MIVPLLAVLAVGALQAPQPPDTLRLAADDAFRMALVAAPALEAARRRAAAADARARQAGAWTNPVLSITAENLGATRSTTGIAGPEGVEGQALLGALLPIGGDLSAARSGARALLVEARALEAGTEVDVRMAVVQALSRARRDEQRLGRALEEAAGLEALADALGAQAELGRAPTGEAARAHLAMVSAHTAAAEVAAEAAASREELALLLGLDPGTPFRVEAPVCRASTSGLPGGASTAEVRAAAARLDAAAANLALERAARIPDLTPQVGIRRGAGVSALYVGVSIPVPLFNRSGAAVAAARAEEEAAAAELDQVERSVAAGLESTRQGLAALEAAGTLYTDDWSAALDQTVLAAEARYRLGEGSLTELLDGRRARLQALDDYERWRAQLFVQRALLARLSGETIDASLLCGVPLSPETHPSEKRP